MTHAKPVRPVLCRIAAVGAIGLFLWFVWLFYVPGQGFSVLLLLGDREAERHLPELRALDVFVHQDSYGYDGQHYVQLAMRPDPTDPELQVALDNPLYRARRMLLSWTAWLLAGGDGARALHIFSIQNVVAWLALALVLLRWFPLNTWNQTFRWFAVLFSIGLWLSVRGSLLDGPSLLLIAGGVALVESGRRWTGAAVLGVSGLARETNVLAGVSIPPTSFPSGNWAKSLAQIALVLLPITLWVLALQVLLKGVRAADAANFALPFEAYWREWYESLTQFRAGAWHRPAGAGVFVIIALTVQALFLFLRPRVSSLWWRVGTAYAALMLVLGDAVWEGFPGAAPRVLLPMTLAFNVLVPTSRRWWPVLVLGNLTLVPALLTAPPGVKPIERVEGPRALRVNSITESEWKVRFDEHWYGIEQSRYAGTRWQWANGDAALLLENPHDFPVQTRLTFVVGARDSRRVELRVNGATIWAESIGEGLHPAKIDDLVLPPGRSRLDFVTDTPPTPASEHDSRPIAFNLREVRITLIRSLAAVPPDVLAKPDA
jgi:hypothetical protein